MGAGDLLGVVLEEVEDVLQDVLLPLGGFSGPEEARLAVAGVEVRGAGRSRDIRGGIPPPVGGAGIPTGVRVVSLWQGCGSWGVQSVTSLMV